MAKGWEVCWRSCSDRGHPVVNGALIGCRDVCSTILGCVALPISGATSCVPGARPGTMLPLGVE